MAQARSKRPRRKFDPDRNAAKIMRGRYFWSRLLGRGASVNQVVIRKNPLVAAVQSAFRGGAKWA